MHRVTSTIREIKPADLPKVNGKKATADQLLNLGIAHLDGDLYECREQENNHHSTPDAPMVPLVEHKGKVISEGPVQTRHDRLPAEIKVDLWRAKVRTTKGTGKKKRVVLEEKDVTTIKPKDDVAEAGIKKHRWEGEAER